MNDNKRYSVYTGNEFFSEKTIQSPDPVLCSTSNRNGSDSYKSVYKLILPYKIVIEINFKCYSNK